MERERLCCLEPIVERVCGGDLGQLRLVTVDAVVVIILFILFSKFNEV